MITQHTILYHDNIAYNVLRTGSGKTAAYMLARAPSGHRHYYCYCYC